MTDVDSRLGIFIRALLLACTMFVYLTFVSQTAQAKTVADDEKHLLIAYIYNIGKFVDWPADRFDSQSHFNVCFYGNVGSLAHSMQALNGKTIQGKPLKARMIKRGKKMNGCHILYVSQSEKAYFPTIIQLVRGHPVLTLSDSESWAQHGGMVGFATENKSLVFDVNNKAFNDANLSLSSAVLRLARNVIR